MKMLLNINKPLLTLENWLVENKQEGVDSTNSSNEEIMPTSTNVGQDASQNISTDIDTILSKLKDLEDKMDEDDSGYYFDLVSNVNEAGDDAMGKIKDFMIVAPKIRKLQQKANKIKINKVDMQFAADTAPDPDKKDSIKDKIAPLTDMIKELETQIDTYQKDSGGPYSLKIKNMTRIKGNLEMIKRQTGMSDDPKEKSSLKDRMAKLAGRYKEEVVAAKELKKEGPSPAEIYKQTADQLRDAGWKKGEAPEGTKNTKMVDSSDGTTKEEWYKPEEAEGETTTKTEGETTTKAEGETTTKAEGETTTKKKEA